MSILKKIPWFSLTLVLLSYSTLGWMIFEEKAPWYIWLLTVVTILLSLICFTNPWLKINEYASILFKSSTKSFGVAILAAFLFFSHGCLVSGVSWHFTHFVRDYPSQNRFPNTCFKTSDRFWLYILCRSHRFSTGCIYQALYIKYPILITLNLVEMFHIASLQFLAR